MTNEIEKILENAEDCLLSAEYNFKGGWYKAAINRTYYCMFDSVTALLRDKELSAKTHQGAHILFRQHYIKTEIIEIQMAENLAQVFVLRQSSDYDFEYEPDAVDILAAIDHARTFLAATRAYFEARR